jgi:hypothetical protein
MSTEEFSFNVIFQKPHLVLQCQEDVRFRKDYSCQVVVDNPTDGTSFSYNNLPNNLTGNNNTGLISGSANAAGSHDISVTAQNEYGGSDSENFTLNINTYCGDGQTQDPNYELTGGPKGNGREDCDGDNNVATFPGASSVDKQYACTTGPNDEHDQPVPLGTCTFIGGYCGDGVVQTDLEECDFGSDIDDCCVTCAWEYSYEQTSLSFQSGDPEAYIDKNDTVFIDFPEVRGFAPDSGLMDAEIIPTTPSGWYCSYILCPGLSECIVKP